jgi:selenocysteine-specific elongation factor
MIVCTAGHIDHGKTTLVKALTGVDTDRLPQEKARGISIDLGFAYWREPSGSVIGFVDVPGHERFVRNMLAGVCAIDFALLIVAADDGVMPQTREHLNIVDLLGIRRGLAVITKCDRVDGARLEDAAREVESLLAGSALEGARVLPASGVTGEGIQELRDALGQAARGFHRDGPARLGFRYAIDRAFTVAGSGTVVTGTVFDGSVKPGDRVVLSPSGRELRVRGIQKDGAKADRAEAGERCALNLAGIEVSQVRRGDWALDPQLHAPTARLDVEVRVLPGEQRALGHWTPVHLHLGTREVTARVSLRRGESVPAGGKAFARLITDEPIAALHGDRFILRDQSAQRTVGGGIVLDAFPAARRLPYELRERQLLAFAAGSPARALQGLVECTPSGVNVAVFARNFNLEPGAFQRVLKETGLTTVGSGSQTLAVTPERARALQPVKRLVAQENPEHVRLWQLAQPVLLKAGRGGMTVPQLAQDLRAKEPVLVDMLHGKSKAGEAVRVGDDRFYLRATMDEFAAVARALAKTEPQGRFTLARFRDEAGIGRALAAHVLEAVDRLGVTRRVGDARVLRESTQHGAIHP